MLQYHHLKLAYQTHSVLLQEVLQVAYLPLIFEQQKLNQAFVDEKAYLVSIDEGGKKEGKKDNDFPKYFPKESMEEITDRQRIILSLVQSDCTLLPKRFPKKFRKKNL